MMRKAIFKVGCGVVGFFMQKTKSLLYSMTEGRDWKKKEMKSKGKLEQALLQFQFLPFYLQGF